MAGSLPIDAQKVTFHEGSISLKQAFEKLESSSAYKIAYNDSQLDVSRKVSMDQKDMEVLQVLSQLLKNTGYTYKINGNYVIIVPEEVKTVKGKKQVSGVIVDTNGDPVIGANVVEKGTTNGTITDLDGKFTLEVNDNSVLQVSYIGYNTQEVSANGKTSFSIKLGENTQTLDEVVVVGYGTMKKSDLTGSVTNVKAEKLLSKPVVNVGQALAGKASGVEIFENGGTPDGKVRVRIRGNNSINSSNEPLYVVDGVIGVSNINLLNPSEIESLEVLKDASATAIYGARGANGVIMITTKRGIKNEKAQISYDGYVSIGKMAKKLDLMNASEWWQNYNTTIRKDNDAIFDFSRLCRSHFNISVIPGNAYGLIGIVSSYARLLVVVSRVASCNYGSITTGYANCSSHCQRCNYVRNNEFLSHFSKPQVPTVRSYALRFVVLRLRFGSYAPSVFRLLYFHRHYTTNS